LRQAVESASTARLQIINFLIQTIRSDSASVGDDRGL
jgi:hypothetical protein